RIDMGGAFPASAVHDALAANMQLSGTLGWQDGVRLEADLAWQELTATLARQPDGEPELTANGPGLDATFEAGELLARLDGFNPNPYLSLPVELPPLTGTVTGP